MDIREPAVSFMRRGVILSEAKNHCSLFPTDILL